MKVRLVRPLLITGLLIGGLAGPAVADVVKGTSGDDMLTGTARKDTMYGYEGNDTIVGLAGQDRLYGGAGNDVLRGRRDADSLRGGAGADRLVPGVDGFFSDRLFGGPGPDRIRAFWVDVVRAGCGNDVVKVVQPRGPLGWPVQIDCGPGEDTVIWLRGEVFDSTSCEHVLAP